jgi:uncharacterized membrane protein
MRMKKNTSPEPNHDREKWSRSLVKTLSYRVIILIMDFSVIYWLTGKTEVALGFTVTSNIYTILAYYLHERIWSRIKWGIKA